MSLEPRDGPALPEPQLPLTLLLLQGQLVLVVTVEITPEEKGEFGVLLLLLHRHLLELGPVPRHELRQLVDDIPQLLICGGEAGRSSPAVPAVPAPSPLSPLPPRSRGRPLCPDRGPLTLGRQRHLHGRRSRARWAAPHGRKSCDTRAAALYGPVAMETVAFPALPAVASAVGVTIVTGRKQERKNGSAAGTAQAECCC